MSQHGSLPTLYKQENIANAKEYGFYNNLSEDNKELLHSLSSATMVIDRSNRTKIQFLSALFDYADPDFIAHTPFLYTCSGLDIELPLLAGARDITMQDIEFDGMLHSKLENRLICFEGYEKKDGVYQIQHDFGYGLEDVKIKEVGGDIRKFEPGKKYGTIIEFFGAVKDMTSLPLFNKNLMIGGYLRCDDIDYYSLDHKGYKDNDEVIQELQKVESQGYKLISCDDTALMFRKEK